MPQNHNNRPLPNEGANPRPRADHPGRSHNPNAGDSVRRSRSPYDSADRNAARSGQNAPHSPYGAPRQRVQYDGRPPRYTAAARQQAGTHQQAEASQQAGAHHQAGARQQVRARQGAAPARRRPQRSVQPEPRRSKTPFVIGTAVVVLAVAIWLFVGSLSVKVTVNGQEVTVGNGKTVEAAFEASGVSVSPGDLVAVDGSVLESGKGYLFSASVNGQAVQDHATVLSNNDVVEFTDGGDIEEEYDGVDSPIAFTVSSEGSGALHVYEGDGTDGVETTKTGKISGKTATVTTTEPSNVVCRYYNVDVGDDKVIALTFDDGPTSQYTQGVLDVLAENNAKATFFTLGEQVESMPDIVKRAAEAGHQICTHTYDHAEGSGQGVNLGLMSAEEQIQEVQKGQAANDAAVGSETSRAFRSPGGNFNEQTMKTLRPYITSEIGWNVDTEDWKRPGADVIASRMLSVKPGQVILCHDGGGNRSQTVEALRQALPQLREQGYSFITIDELLKYPAKG